MYSFLEETFDRAWLYPQWSRETTTYALARAVISREQRQRFYKLLVCYRDRGVGAPTDLKLWWMLVEEETGLITKINYTGLDPEKFKNTYALLCHREGKEFVLKMRSDLPSIEKRITEAHETAHVIFDFYLGDRGVVKERKDTQCLRLDTLSWTHEFFCESIAAVILCMPHEVERYLKAHFRFPLQMDLFDRSFKGKANKKFFWEMAEAFQVSFPCLWRQLEAQFGERFARSLLTQKITHA